MSERRVRQRIATGELNAFKKCGRWWVEEWNAYEDLVIPKRGVGRRLDPATVWGVVAVLAEVDPSWLSASQRCRVRQRVARSTPTQLAAAVGPDLDFTDRPLHHRELLRVAISFRSARQPSCRGPSPRVASDR